MNEQLVKILEKAYEAAVKTGEFVIEEGGILIEQFFIWKTWQHVLLVIIGLLLSIIFPLVYRGACEEDSGYNTVNFFGKIVSEGNGVLGYFISMFFIIAGGFMFFINLFSLIKVLVAPNVYLLEYILNKM